jgi:hypothetical protein
MSWQRRKAVTATSQKRRLACAAAPRVFTRASSSLDAVSANDSQAAITRPIRLGSATATLAASLATLPATSSAYGAPHCCAPTVNRPAAR